MKIQQVVVLVLLSALCPVAAKLNIFTGATGGNGSITCSFTVRGDKKFFCKDDCKGENVLVETDGVTAENGRHSVRYTEGQTGSSSEKSSLVVTIRNLTKSDSGRYRCGIGETSTPQMYTQFGVRVVDDPVHGNTWFAYTNIEGENITHGCSGDPVPGGWKFFCRDNCSKTEDVLIETNNAAQSSRFSLEYRENSFYGLYVAISNVTSSDSGWYRCGHGRALSSASFITFPLIVIPDPSSTESPEEASDAEEQRSNCPTDALLYVVVVLAVIISVLGVALTLTCVQKTITPHDLNSRGRKDDANLEVRYDKYNPPAAGCEVTIYENLDLAKEDQRYHKLS